MRNSFTTLCRIRTSTTYVILHGRCAERMWLTGAPMILVELDNVAFRWVKQETPPVATFERKNKTCWFRTCFLALKGSKYSPILVWFWCVQVTIQPLCVRHWRFVFEVNKTGNEFWENLVLSNWYLFIYETFFKDTVWILRYTRIVSGWILREGKLVTLRH